MGWVIYAPLLLKTIGLGWSTRSANLTLGDLPAYPDPLVSKVWVGTETQKHNILDVPLEVTVRQLGGVLIFVDPVNEPDQVWMSSIHRLEQCTCSPPPPFC